MNTTETRAETPLGARIRTYERKLARACNQYHVLKLRLDELIARRAAAAARDQTNFLYSLTLRTGILEGVVNVLQLYIEKLCDEIRTLRIAAYLCSLRSSRIQIDEEEDEEEDDEDYIDDYESDIYGHDDIEDDDIYTI